MIEAFPAIVNAEHLELTRHILLGLPITMGMFKPSAGSGLLVPAYRTVAIDNGDRVSYTFSTQYIGPASDDRFVIVCAGGRQTSSRNIVSCTVGGVATTLLVGADGVAHTAMFVTDTPIPAGTTASITVTCNGGTARLGIGVFSLTGTNRRKPVVIGIARTSYSTANLDIAAGGVIVGTAYSINAGNPYFTGITKYGSASLEGPNYLGVGFVTSDIAKSIAVHANGESFCFASIRAG
jgi:hypothetical protein